MPRNDPRVPAKLAVSYRTQGAFLVSYSVNLSKGGIFIESTDPLPVGSEVTLRIDVPDLGALELVGDVAWVRQASPDGFPEGFGIKLRDLDERYGDAIDRMVQEFVGLTVLVLASSPDRLTLLGRYVRSIISCEVLEATTPEDADNALAAMPDLVVIDIERSRVLGVQTVQMIRAHRRGAQTPIILLGDNAQKRELARQAGADETLETPPSFSALQAAVIRTLSKPAQVIP